MKITSSYGVEVLHKNKIFKPTIVVFQNAVSFFVDVIFNEKETFFDGKKLGMKDAKIIVEQLTHSTKARPAVKYDFDQKFYKFPSYLRRAAIAEAYGIVSSHLSNHKNWEDGGRKGGEPRLQRKHDCMPTFYYTIMFAGSCYGTRSRIKLLRDGDWVWEDIDLKKTDVDYLNKHWSGRHASAPVLERRYGKYFLRFSFETDQKLKNTPIEDQRIVAVDLGLNNHAVCSVMDARGTVCARKFIDLPHEKDLLTHKLNKLKKFQRQHGSYNSQSQWSHINNLNNEISRKVAHEIVNFAVLYDVDTIVMEYLDFNGKKLRGSKAQRIAIWQKRDIQKIVEHQAHRNGIRFSRINPNGTSKYAYDGSGPVMRDKNNFSQCTFTSGKQYNCDLSASYNIGARYFIREIIKPLPVTVRSQLEAKVPLIAHRTQCTLATLISLNKVLCQLAA